MKDENVYFRPRARLMLELGEQLIKNESVAMLELIKNSYDAFARNVNVRLDNIDDCDAGLIVIEDDGIGMTKETVVNHWMEPATFAGDNGYSDENAFVEKFGKDSVVKAMLVQKAQDYVIEHANIAYK